MDGRTAQHKHKKSLAAHARTNFTRWTRFPKNTGRNGKSKEAEKGRGVLLWLTSIPNDTKVRAKENLITMRVGRLVLGRVLSRKDLPASTRHAYVFLRLVSSNHGLILLEPERGNVKLRGEQDVTVE